MEFLKEILKKDINTGLLILVMFLLMLLAGFNVYYQNMINDFSVDCSAKQEQLTAITGRLSLEKAKSSEVILLKDITEKNIEFLEKDYNQLTSENELLKNIVEQNTNSKNGIGSCKATGSAECPG